jgi:hypothetical protein
MWSRIQDLERFKLDQKRFQLGIDAQDEVSVRQQGEQLLDDLTNAVIAFDGIMENLVRDHDRKSRLDHATAQENVRVAKDDMENWMMRYAPNVHVEQPALNIS